MALQVIRRSSPTDFLSEAKKALVGKSVLTVFNYENYRIDDIVSFVHSKEPFDRS